MNIVYELLLFNRNCKNLIFNFNFMIINFDNLKSTLMSYKAIGIALLCMILIFWTLSFINWKIEDAKKIALLDVEKTKRIVDIEKEIKPLEKEINTLQTKLSPLLECRATIKNSLGQLDNPSCEKGDNDNKETLIPKAKAEEIVESDRDKILMERICNVSIHWKKSPLCNNWELYNSGKNIFESKGVSWSIALGIMFAESHIGANYAGTCNESWNNWGWIKWRIQDDWTAIKDQPIPNGWGCWLYKFDNVNDYFNSKANTLLKYKSCFSQERPIRCISFRYVGDPNVAEQSWIDNVAKIAF